MIEIEKFFLNLDYEKKSCGKKVFDKFKEDNKNSQSFIFFIKDKPIINKDELYFHIYNELDAKEKIKLFINGYFGEKYNLQIISEMIKDLNDKEQNFDLSYNRLKEVFDRLNKIKEIIDNLKSSSPIINSKNMFPIINLNLLSKFYLLIKMFYLIKVKEKSFTYHNFQEVLSYNDETTDYILASLGGLNNYFDLDINDSLRFENFNLNNINLIDILFFIIINKDFFDFDMDFFISFFDSIDLVEDENDEEKIRHYRKIKDKSLFFLYMIKEDIKIREHGQLFYLDKLYGVNRNYEKEGYIKKWEKFIFYNETEVWGPYIMSLPSDKLDIYIGREFNIFEIEIKRFDFRKEFNQKMIKLYDLPDNTETIIKTIFNLIENIESEDFLDIFEKKIDVYLPENFFEKKPISFTNLDSISSTLDVIRLNHDFNFLIKDKLDIFIFRELEKDFDDFIINNIKKLDRNKSLKIIFENISPKVLLLFRNYILEDEWKNVLQEHFKKYEDSRFIKECIENYLKK